MRVFVHVRRGALCVAVALTALFGALAAVPAAARTIWLCKPGSRPDPCTPGLSTTVYSPKLRPLRVVHPRPLATPPIDCFYVYPTVSDQRTPNANLHIDPVERSIALYQAARYSQYCRVYAPMYRQVTLAAPSGAAKNPSPAVALSDVRSAFRTYLARYNRGRGFVLIGHSQGAFILRKLISADVDAKPHVRRRLVSAILLGGNVLVRHGSEIGGDFHHVPGCRSADQLGCVIAFSTYDQPVPRNSLFGRTTVPGDAVLCTNPASLHGGSGIVDPIFPSKPFAPGAIALGISLLGLTQPMPATVWSEEPGAYRARCSSAGGATVLEVKALHGAQVPRPSPDPSWGLHLLDANVALGDLVRIVREQSIAYARTAH